MAAQFQLSCCVKARFGPKAADMVTLTGIIRSKLESTITRDGVSVQFKIFRAASEEGWTLEIIDRQGGSTVWEEPFPTDTAAFAEAMAAIVEEGIAEFGCMEKRDGSVSCDSVSAPLGGSPAG